MKRSLQVAAPLLAATAGALLATGCHQPPEPQRCVDEHNRVVDAKLCATLPQTQGLNGIQSGNQQNSPFSPLLFPYHYYYGGTGGFAPGAIVTGGSATPLTGNTYSGSSTTRGGFGSTFGGGSRGSGGGEGGGAGE